LKFDELFVRDVEGERRLGGGELPLRVGTGSDCNIRLPGPGGAPVALIDLLDGEPFVQPVGRGESLTLNGDPLTASRRLADGDEMQFYGSRIAVAAGSNRLVLEVRLEDSAYVTKPPEVADTGGQAEEETIAPAAFRRAADTSAGAGQEHKRSPLRMILGGGLAALVVVSYLLFSAKSIQFEVDPTAPDSVSIDGGWFRLPLGDRVLLRKGDYTVNITKDGYYDVSQSFVVDDEPSKTIELRMRKLPGRLTVLTEPLGDAIVTIDNALVGPAPYGPVELQPGHHSVSVQSERFLPFVGAVDVPGLGRAEEMFVQLVPRWSDVSITSEPGGADILVGEDTIGTTPAVVQLLEGTHKVSVVASGFSAWDGVVEAEPNTAMELPLIRLEPADAKLRVNSIPRGANVTVNGRYRGQAPMTLDLAPSVDFEIGLSKAGYGSTTREVRLSAAASESITVDLSARTGSVTINVQPSDATIYVDGRARSRGASTLKLSSAPHRIEVKKPGYISWSRTVTPRPGYPQTMTARLKSLEAAERDKVAINRKSAAGQDLRRVEPGTFSMGASRSEQGRRANEVIVPVTISDPFLISTREVTNKEFTQFRKNHDSGADTHASLAADGNPVANVSWDLAAQYCNWLSKQEGLSPVYKEEFGKWVPVLPFPDGYRLPTEAEWVWAVRYGNRDAATKFTWGNKWPPPKGSGNFADRSAVDLVPSILPGFDDGYASTAPVGSFKANGLGIFDGMGNVAEWVNDFYTVPTPGQTRPLSNPIGPETGTNHVIRGSGWRHAGITELRLSYRDYGSTARSDVGFRIARNAD
jgi:formylglycine-generating enzyme required for sulfatase activity